MWFTSTSGAARAVSRRMLEVAVLTIIGVAPMRALSAQKTRLDMRSVDEIVDAALPVYLAPGDSLSQLTIAKRKVFFDFARTDSAFGIAKRPPRSLGSLLQTPVANGTAELMRDCDTIGRKPCAQLGWSAYVWVEPRSIAKDTAIVRVHVSWPSRNNSLFQPNTAPAGAAYLTGFAAEIHLRRNTAGHWRFLRQGTTIVGH